MIDENKNWVCNLIDTIPADMMEYSPEEFINRSNMAFDIALLILNLLRNYPEDDLQNQMTSLDFINFQVQDTLFGDMGGKFGQHRQHHGVMVPKR